MPNLTKGSARERIDHEEAQRLTNDGALISDQRRSRPLYFDGRFLAARDLVREQRYFLTRQADLGKAIGAGIVEGLLVSTGPGAVSLRIDPGHGITPSGESLVLTQPLIVRLADDARAQSQNNAFGLATLPSEPARGRTGLYVLGLRPVEFTSNPIASYPTSLNGKRSVEDGDIIEAVAVTLVEYPDEGGRDEFAQRRARVAREIFALGGKRSIPSPVLPLALVALDGNIVQWIDPFLLRREIGAEQSDILGLGTASRALREAYIQQYNRHLEDIESTASPQERIAATEHFLALPPAGRFPVSSIDSSQFMQHFFPAEMEVDLSVIPEDELGATIEASLLLPPIDLTSGGDHLESASAMVLIPVPRGELRQAQARLSQKKLLRTFRPAAPGLVAARKPFEVLRSIRAPFLVRPVVDPADLADAEWRRLLGEADALWYVRRRNLAYETENAGVPLVIAGDDFASQDALTERLRGLRLGAAFDRLTDRASFPARAEMVRILSALPDSNVIVRTAFGELEAIARPDLVAVMAVGDRYATPGIGEGLARLEAAEPSLRETGITTALVESGLTPEIDRIGRQAPEEQIAVIASEIAEAAQRNDPDGLQQVVDARLNELDRA